MPSVCEVANQHGFRVALIGDFALPFHGVRRATGDVDFLVDADGERSRRSPRLLEKYFALFDRSPRASRPR
jgi:hypothetical protein